MNDQKPTGVTRTFTHRIPLTDDELARGRELERIAAAKKLEAGFAEADVDNYYDQFFARDAQGAVQGEVEKRAEEWVEKFWRERGVKFPKAPSGAPSATGDNP